MQVFGAATAAASGTAAPGVGAPPQSCHVIINPRARQGRATRLLPHIETFLRQRHPRVQLHCCGTLGDLERVFADLPRHSRVVGVGGDGTNHVLLPHLLRGAHQYGLLPQGSGNDVARSVGVHGWAWQTALEHALLAPARAVDVGLLHDEDSPQSRYFLGCCLLGLDAYIANLTQPWKLSGSLPYLLTLLAQLPRLRGWAMEMEWYDPHGHCERRALRHLLLCSVLNTPTYGSGMPIAPMARMDDHQLDLLHVPMRGRIDVLRLLAQMLRGQHVGQPGVFLQPMRQLRVRANEFLPISLDGEVLDWKTRAVRVELHASVLPIVHGGVHGGRPGAS